MFHVLAMEIVVFVVDFAYVNNPNRERRTSHEVHVALERVHKILK